VREQLRLAAGRPLEIPADLTPRGHAIECRITSEDPFQGFVPATGRISALRVPTGPGVRWDGGIDVGTDVGVFYDPLLAKLIVWGETRDHAIRRMRRALEELLIVGVPTSQAFHHRVMGDPLFASGAYDLGYLDLTGSALLDARPDPALLEQAAVAAALAEHEARAASVVIAAEPPAGTEASPWLRAARLAGLR
jgi:acetyl-CoA carboxylase biotin carboxylase subunit